MKTFPFDPKLKLPLIEAKLSNAQGFTVSVIMVLDTGSTRTVLFPDTVAMLGYPVKGKTTKSTNTASGKTQMPFVQIEGIEALGKKQLRPVVGIKRFQSSLNIDGLLGSSFFMGKKLCIDYKKGIVTLR